MKKFEIIPFIIIFLAGAAAAIFGKGYWGAFLTGVSAGCLFFATMVVTIGRILAKKALDKIDQKIKNRSNSKF